MIDFILLVQSQTGFSRLSVVNPNQFQIVAYGFSGNSKLDTELIFVNPGATIHGQYYQYVMHLLPTMCQMLQQDSALTHHTDIKRFSCFREIIPVSIATTSVKIHQQMWFKIKLHIFYGSRYMLQQQQQQQQQQHRAVFVGSFE